MWTVRVISRQHPGALAVTLRQASGVTSGRRWQMRLRHPDGQTVYLASTLPSQSEHEVRGVFALLADAVAGTDAQRDAEPASLSLVINPSFASALAGSIGMRRRLQYGLASRGYEVVTLVS